MSTTPSLTPLPLFDPRLVPVRAESSTLPPVPRDRLSAEALRQRFQHSGGGNRGQQNARVLLHHPQQRIVVAAAPVERHGVEIPAAGFIPLS